MKSVSFSYGGLRDRDIIFRDLVFCFLGCVVKFPAREANSSLPAVLAFFTINAHTHTETRKVRRHAESLKETENTVRFT